MTLTNKIPASLQGLRSAELDGSKEEEAKGKNSDVR